jgi:outer membrane protein assembly factor BamE
MRMLSTCSDRAPALIAGTLFLLLAAALAGCASKNPLMEEPAGSSASKAAPAAAPKSAAATISPNASAATAGTGVQTVRQRRFLGFLSPYRIDIQQGNFVSQEMVLQLKEGMTHDQVRFVLGTPLLTDIFHADRWDYPFRLQKGNGEVTTSRVTVLFKDNRLVRFEGGDLPTEQDYLARLAGAAARK